MITGMKAGFSAGDRRAFLSSALVVVIALTFAFATTLSRAQQTGASTAAMAQLQSEQRFDIPAQPLTDALVAFGRQSGIQVTIDGTLARDRSSPTVRGAMSGAEALTRLLAGTGLTYVVADDTTVAIEKPGRQHSDSAFVLRPITVEGDAESAYGPIEGFRAKGSSAATNVDAPLIETPATVNVATGDFIDTIGARRIEEILQYVPGASAESVNASGTGFNIRGFSTTLVGGVAAGEGSVQIDNHWPAGRRYHFDPALYERIDILKGGAALLYGTADPGGVVRFVTKKPQFETNYRFEGTLGSFETARGTIDFTGPLGESGHAAYRLIATGLTSNQSFHGDNDDISFDDRLIINPQLTWRTPGGGELNLSYEYSKHESTFDPGIKRLADGSFTFNSEPFLSPDNSIDRENHIGVAEFTQPIGDKWEILVGGSIGRTDGDLFTDASFGSPDGNDKLGRSTQSNAEDFEQEGVRAQLSGQFNTGSLLRHQVTLGGSYFSSKNIIFRRSVFQSGVIDARNPVFGPAQSFDSAGILNIDTRLKEHAFYLQDYISVGDRLKLFGGVRYTDAKGELIIPEISRFNTGEQDSIDYSVGAIYNQNHWFNPFVSYSTSLVPQVGSLADSPEPLPFSEGEQIEIGVKSEWLGERLATTVSLFQIEQTSIVESNPANPGFSILAGDQRTRGFEFEAVGEITDQISLIGGYSYLDAKFIAGTNEDNRPHSVPKHKVSLFGQYKFAAELAGWRAGLGFIHVGERQGNNANTFELPTYERIDAFIGYEHSGFDFRLAIENVLNEDYIIGGDAGENFAQGAPRFFTLTVGYEFQ